MFVSTIALAAALPSPQEICGPACAPEAVASATVIDGATRANSAMQIAQLQDAAQPSTPPDATASDTRPADDDEVTDPNQTSGSEADADGNMIVVTGDVESPSEDPVEELNAAAYEAAQEIDQKLVEPIAQVYDEVLPKPIRSGLRNFLTNIGEPVNFLNFLLQFKIGKALKSAGRFAINSTLGVAGLFEVASKKPFSLEHESNGFANTLGYYGIGPGPYLYLPLIGSTTVRDLAGRFADLSVVPNIVGPPLNRSIYTIPVATLNSLETRVRTDEQIDAIRELCGDPYSAKRDIYLIQRQIEIDSLRGRTSDGLNEMVERLEFNCDIDVLVAGDGAMNAEGFIRENTTLLEDGEEAQNADVRSIEEPEPAGQPEDDQPGTQSTTGAEADDHLPYTVDGQSREPAAEIDIVEEPANDNSVTVEERTAQPLA